MKIVVNKCFGGFGLSRFAFLELRKMGNKYALKETDIGEKWKNSNEVRDKYLDSFLSDIPRDDKDLVAIVEKLGKDASAPFSELKVIEIPDDVEWEIDEYDGVESIHEKHRSW